MIRAEQEINGLLTPCFLHVDVIKDALDLTSANSVSSKKGAP